MSSKSPFKKRGVFTGGGADKTFVLGFAPAYVKVINVTDRISGEKTDTMGAAKALTVAADGTATYADNITLTSDGFTVAAALAVAAKELHYYAEESIND